MALEASKFAPEDFISMMPADVLTNILERLPLQDAVRTGILSRKWRFKWTMLSQLLFDPAFFQFLMITKDEKNCGRIISMLLLNLKGAITKFLLTMVDVEAINHWMLFLSRKGIKDLTIVNWIGSTQVKLPTHLFLCLELKHLKLHNCYFNPPPTFHGFPNLLSLELRVVQCGSADLGEFFTRCPSLEILDLGYLSSTSNVKLADFAKLENLHILSVTLCDLHPSTIISSRSIFELVGSLSKLQELDLDFQDFKLTEDGGIRRFPNAFPCLKALKLKRVDLGNGIMLSCVFEMIRHFSSLQTIEITTFQCDTGPVPEIEHITTGLKNVVVTSFEGSEYEMCLIKYILACSPFLKRIAIYPACRLDSSKQLIFARKLLKLQRVSSIAEIELLI